MHNVNILTIHKEPNYGAVLQAYALYKTIENLGHVPYIINLDMDYNQVMLMVFLSQHLILMFLEIP